MNPVTDLSDEAMAMRWGGILHEIPELWDTLRKWEIENRPAVTSGGFKMRADWVSVQREGSMLRLRVGNTRG